MALTKAQLREILSGAGADPEKVAEAVDRIIAGHTASIEALREERDQLKEKVEAGEKVQKELDELKANSGDIAKLQKEYDDFKTQVANEKAHAEKETAFKQVLKDIGIPERHYAVVCKYSNIDGLELDNGKIKGVKELAKELRDEWSDHIETQSTSGTVTPTPQSTSTSVMSKKEIMQIKNTAERQAALKQYMNAQTVAQKE